MVYCAKHKQVAQTDGTLAMTRTALDARELDEAGIDGKLATLIEFWFQIVTHR